MAKTTTTADAPKTLDQIAQAERDLAAARRELLLRELEQAYSAPPPAVEGLRLEAMARADFGYALVGVRLSRPGLEELPTPSALRFFFDARPPVGGVCWHRSGVPLLTDLEPLLARRARFALVERQGRAAAQEYLVGRAPPTTVWAVIVHGAPPIVVLALERVEGDLPQAWGELAAPCLPWLPGTIGLGALLEAWDARLEQLELRLSDHTEDAQRAILDRLERAGLRDVADSLRRGTARRLTCPAPLATELRALPGWGAGELERAERRARERARAEFLAAAEPLW